MLSITERAQAAIGRDNDVLDWQLRPDDHAKALPSEAGALSRILRRPEIRELIEQFEKADAAANAAQRRYKRIGCFGLYSATIASLVGALFLQPVESWRAGWPGNVAFAMQMLAMVGAFIAARLLLYTKAFDLWMKQRAVAETARINLFDRIIRIDEPGAPNELPLWSLKLEYFRRYQMDVQRRYYRGRGMQHAAAVWRNNRWMTLSLVITVLAIGLGVLASLHLATNIGVPLPETMSYWSKTIAGQELQRVLLALGVVSSSLYGLGTARSLMDLDERNASRYLVVAENLDFLAEARLTAARQSAAEDNAAPVLAFISDVQSLILSEHKEWLLLREIRADPDKLRYAPTG